MASITDELREWFKDRMFMGNGWREIRDIADRIDAEYEAKVSYWQGASYKDGYDEGFASADDWLGQHEDAMAEHGWVKLPVDADGVPICVGDVMECGDGTVFTVEYISLHPFGWRCGGDGIDGNGYECTAHPLPHSCRHHHEPTVEDVLREIVHKCQPTYSKDGSYTTGLTEEEFSDYASRLRLAGDE